VLTPKAPEDVRSVIHVRRASTAARVLHRSLRTRGLRGTLKRFRRLIARRGELKRQAREDQIFDRERGVDTATWVHVPELDTTSANLEHAMRYQPSGVAEFELLMGKLEIDHRDFTFVDYGSGKGRVLMLAAGYPFKRIVGIEFAESLHEIAVENIATLGPDASHIEAMLMDATEYEPPPDPLVLYFFSPFSAQILRQVLARVLASLERKPRAAYIVLTGPPSLAEAVEDLGFERRDVEELGWRTRGVFSGPSGPGTAGRMQPGNTPLEARSATSRSAALRRAKRPAPRAPSSGSSR
jgi:hypothetical protein